MTHIQNAAHLAANVAYDQITEFDVDVPALEHAIREELRSQEVAFLDRLNDTAPIPIGPEEECPV